METEPTGGRTRSWGAAVVLQHGVHARGETGEAGPRAVDAVIVEPVGGWRLGSAGSPGRSGGVAASPTARSPVLKKDRRSLLGPAPSRGTSRGKHHLGCIPMTPMASAPVHQLRRVAARHRALPVAPSDTHQAAPRAGPDGRIAPHHAPRTLTVPACPLTTVANRDGLLPRLVSAILRSRPPSAESDKITSRHT